MPPHIGAERLHGFDLPFGEFLDERVVELGHLPTLDLADRHVVRVGVMRRGSPGIAVVVVVRERHADGLTGLLPDERRAQRLGHLFIIEEERLFRLLPDDGRARSLVDGLHHHLDVVFGAGGLFHRHEVGLFFQQLRDLFLDLLVGDLVHEPRHLFPGDVLELEGGPHTETHHRVHVAVELVFELRQDGLPEHFVGSRFEHFALIGFLYAFGRQCLADLLSVKLLHERERHLARAKAAHGGAVALRPKRLVEFLRHFFGGNGYVELVFDVAELFDLCLHRHRECAPWPESRPGRAVYRQEKGCTGTPP